MATYIKNADIFGRIGSGIGQGISDSLPKEIERGRLAEGLKTLGQQQGLTPFQQFAALSSLPGATPQMIQSGTELLKNQAIRENLSKGKGIYGGNKSDLSNQQRQKLPDFLENQNFSTNKNNPSVKQQRLNEDRQSEEENLIGGGNPTRDAVKTFQPPSPAEYENKLSEIADANPYLDFNQVKGLTDDYYSKLATQPEAVRQEDARLDTERNNLKTEFNNALSLKLQKEGAEIFNDLTGDMQNNLFRAMQRDLIKNKNLSKENAVNKWTQKALELVQRQDELKRLANQGALKSFFNTSENIEKLKAAQKVFAESGNLQEFYNFLRSDSGFGYSAGQAAQISNPRSKAVKEYINNFPKNSMTNRSGNAKKAALDILPLMTRMDRPLAIARNLFDKDPYFDYRTFLNTMNEFQDDYNLSSQQKGDFFTDDRAVLPNWNDVWFLPDNRGLN